MKWFLHIASANSEKTEIRFTAGNKTIVAVRVDVSDLNEEIDSSFGPLH